MVFLLDIAGSDILLTLHFTDLKDFCSSLHSQEPKIEIVG